MEIYNKVFKISVKSERKSETFSKNFSFNFSFITTETNKDSSLSFIRCRYDINSFPIVEKVESASYVDLWFQLTDDEKLNIYFWFYNVVVELTYNNAVFIEYY